MDRIAREGMRLDRAFVTNPLCMPSRASILTGLFPSRHGVWVNGVPLADSAVTLAELLSQSGYQTAALGKLHLKPFGAPDHRESVPDWEETPYGEWVRENFPEAVAKFWDIAGRRPPSDPPMTWKSAVPVEAHSSTWVGNITVEFLQRRSKERPFFAWVGFPDPHHPFCPPGPYAEMYDPAARWYPPR